MEPPSPVQSGEGGRKGLFGGLLRDDSLTALHLASLPRRLLGHGQRDGNGFRGWERAKPASGHRVPGSRYQDRTIVDWAYEYRKERARVERLGAETGLQGFAKRVFEMVQPWLVLVPVGIATGLLSGCLDVLAEWLGDLRAGGCSYAWYLDNASCCSGTDVNELCAEWLPWGDILSVRIQPFRAFVQYAIYIGLSVAFAAAAAILVCNFAPFAFHTGIPEVKTILSGYVIRGYLSPWTLCIKAIGLALAVGSGLSLGKEGPLVHVACCIGNLFLQPFRVFRENEARKREVLSAAAAAGLSTAFGAPLGSVLFVLEELHLASLPQATLWRAFVCAVVATVTLQYFDPYKSGKLVLFQVQNIGLVWRGFELLPLLSLGLAGGIFGAMFIRANIEYAQTRRMSSIGERPIVETAAIAGFTALVSYLIPFMRVPTSELVEALFGECSGPDPLGLCDANRTLSTFFLLCVTAAAKSVLTAMTFGLRVPAGIFLPTIAIGACAGRAVGVALSAIQQANPRLWIFGACPPEGSCISPSMYAVIGATSATAGMTRMTISLVVIMFELTGAIELVLQIMLAAMTAKFTADYISRDGIYEAWINFRGFPYLSAKADYRRDDVLVRDVMNRNVVCLRSSGWTLDEIEQRVVDLNFKGYPVVVSDDDPSLLGFIPHNELIFAIRQIRAQPGVNGRAECTFTPPSPADSPVQPVTSASEFNLGAWMDQAPIALSPDAPMELVVQCFQRLGLRFLLLTDHGKLAGILTKRDVHRHIAPLYASRRARRRGQG